MDAANAQIAAAKVRMDLIAKRQKRQAARLGTANEPLLRLNALLQRITQQPAMLLYLRPGARRDYVHVRATISAVEPVLAARTASLRGQIDVQRELRNQEQIAMQALSNARGSLAERRAALANLAGSSGGDLSGNTALEYERAIGEGERARELVEQLSETRESSQNAALLAALDGPILQGRTEPVIKVGKSAYIAPVKGQLLSGFGEVTQTGYRERGIRLRTVPGAKLIAPAAGKVTFAGRYRGYGNIIIIEHGGGWSTLLAYVEELGVEEGNSVKQGDYVGASGQQSSDVMIELRRNGRPMDIGAMIG
jgi:murein hydrolase activator